MIRNRTTFLLLWLAIIALSASAAPLKTFTIETEGGTITATQDIPPVFLGEYVPLSNSSTPGALSLKKGRGFVSRHWSIKRESLKKFTWGVVVKDGKIDSVKITPANAQYKPYTQMRLILQYEDGTLEAMRMYLAESEQYGTRVVIGRFVKAKTK